MNHILNFLETYCVTTRKSKNQMRSWHHENFAECGFFVHFCGQKWCPEGIGLGSSIKPSSYIQKQKKLSWKSI